MRSIKRSGFSRDDAILYYDFKNKYITKATEIIIKAFSFYLIVTLAISGYIFTKDIKIVESNYFLVVGSVVSILFVIILLSISWGVLTGLRDIENTLRKINYRTFSSLGMNEFFFRGKMVGIIVAICCCLIIFSIGFGFLIKLYYVS